MPEAPALVAHADWSVGKRDRALVVAARCPQGGFVLHAEDPGHPGRLLSRLAGAAGGPAVLGFDLPIGLPEVYARARGIANFPGFLRGLHPDDAFWAPADEVSLSLERPFYPRRPGGTSRALQADRLGVARHRDLWRRCDQPTDRRPGACCMFWTLGAQQCGRAALACWREVLLPGLADPSLDLAIWPFEGELATLARRRRITVVETYPAECYRQLGLPRFAKTREADRAAQAGALLARSADLHADLAPALRDAVTAGFPAGSGGDHAFDALVGCLALLQVLQGRRPEGAPADPAVRQVEGWMVGLDAAALRAAPRAAGAPGSHAAPVLATRLADT